MNTFLAKFGPVDIVALILIVGGLYLKLNGADGVVGSLLAAISFYYFGKRGRPLPTTETKP